MDITNFMSWFLNQAIKIFTWFFTTLENIKFMGTDLLTFSLTILILSSFTMVIFTFSPSVSVLAGKASKSISKKREEKKEHD